MLSIKSVINLKQYQIKENSKFSHDFPSHDALETISPKKISFLNSNYKSTLRLTIKGDCQRDFWAISELFFIEKISKMMGCGLKLSILFLLF